MLRQRKNAALDKDDFGLAVEAVDMDSFDFAVAVRVDFDHGVDPELLAVGGVETEAAFAAGANHKSGEAGQVGSGCSREHAQACMPPVAGVVIAVDGALTVSWRMGSKKSLRRRITEEAVTDWTSE